MAPLGFIPGDVARWTAPTASEYGDSPYDCGPTVTPEAGTDQAVLSQGEPLLEARSGCCLLIVIYAPEARIEAIVHLGRQDTLWPEQADLIRGVFGEFAEVRDSPTVAFVSGDQLRSDYSAQVEQATALISSLAQDPNYRDVVVGSRDRGQTMSVEIELDPSTGILEVRDDIHPWQTVSLA